MNYISTITAISVHREGECPILGDSVTTVTLTDEGGGKYLIIEQDGGKIQVELQELRLIFAAAEKLMGERRG